MFVWTELRTHQSATNSAANGMLGTEALSLFDLTGPPLVGLHGALWITRRPQGLQSLELTFPLALVLSHSGLCCHTPEALNRGVRRFLPQGIKRVLAFSRARGLRANH
ncbi:hypothetical protein AVEN_235331-1 [Araneus ventricosus]|uniref:Uncharacterized protein n=1 Tax=Araneus ventricosus TaxID=182803 RepID=A0A4Y2A4R2_ARAVE|nr:hypothetical protein AVEN_235331-1 [Araneus ventricosus]